MTPEQLEKNFDAYLDRQKLTPADPDLTDRICAAVSEKAEAKTPTYAWVAFHCAFALGLFCALALAFHWSNTYNENTSHGAVVCAPELYLSPFVDHQAQI